MQENVIVSLEEDKEELNEKLEKGKLLFANSLEATAFRVRSFGQKEVTERAKHTDYMDICFVISENPIAEKGRRELFIQVVGPDNNVVADKGAVNFGESSLIYSYKVDLNYNNLAEEICATIKNDEDFKKGIYHVSLFERDRKLGHTQISLY